MKQGVIETAFGFLIICIASFFFVFSYNKSNSSKDIDGYTLIANFQNTDGLTDGNDIKLSGIRIGYVESLTLDPQTYFVLAKLRIKNSIEIPSDSRAIVSTNGLLGAKYIRIDPGASDDNLKNNGKIVFTQSALNIEDLISKLMYSITSK